MYKIAVVGAGFTGAVIARQLAEAGFTVSVFDERKHVAGNCHTSRDSETGIIVHKYGPHIFHTNDKFIWEYVSRFGELVPYTNRVKAVHDGHVYTLPINLLTINNFFGKTFGPKEAQQFLASISDKTISSSITFEQQALSFIGKELYEAFFKEYTYKQWGLLPTELPASILKRLPVRFNYDDNYYNSQFQGIPREGYTAIVERILNHDKITVHLRQNVDRNISPQFSHVFYSGPIDSWFSYRFGSLRYRTLEFQREVHSGDYQGNAVINYPDSDVPFTRITEHKHFSPWETHSETVIFKEFSRDWSFGDIQYYPIRLVHDKQQLREYHKIAQDEENVTFVGRLGTYRYLDMHVAIKEALECVEMFLNCRRDGISMPSFCVDIL
jgi:UDP-galactopyranose mutase